MPKTIGGEIVLEEKKSREAETVLITEKNVYKIYGNQEAAWQSYEIYKEAEAHGVPVVGAAKFAAVLADGSTQTSVAGVCSKRATGQFFQLAKGGGEATLSKAITSITNKSACQQVLSDLEAAAAFGVSDAQGFIDINASRPLALIDVHSVGRWIKVGTKKDPDAVFEPKRTGAFDMAIDAARFRLQQLG